jgi:hypothetical protein
MTIQDYANNQGDDGIEITPVVLFAGDYLQRHGQIFGFGFSCGDAVDKAAELYTVFLDELDWSEIQREARIRDMHRDWT